MCFYAPLDYVFAVRRVLRTLRPSLVIVMETEIWPNLFRETKRTGAGLLMINGRISDRAMGRYRALRWFFGGVLAQVDLLLAQSEEMRQRFLDRHWRPPESECSRGNLKYDCSAARGGAGFAGAPLHRTICARARCGSRPAPCRPPPPAIPMKTKP